MSIRNGREFLATPGPTTIPDSVLRAMHRPAMDIYSEEMAELTDGVMRDLGTLFGTQTRPYVYAANGHGAWDAVLANVLSRGDKVLVLESGFWATSWGRAAHAMGAEVEFLEGDLSRAVRPGEVEARLRADASHSIKAILVAHVDTGSGVVNDIRAIGEAIRAASHPSMFIVDAVASLGCIPFEMDNWGVDVAMSASQKGLMMPPGLSFVAAGQRARAARKTANMCSPYWDWTERDSPEHYNRFAGTAPTHLLFGLRRAIDMLLEEGLENAYRRHKMLAEAVRCAVSVWVRGEALRFNISNPSERSNTVTTVLIDGHDSRPLLRYCNDKCGVVLGIGIRELSGRAFRIAHMGHVNAPMTLGTLGVVEMALAALGIPHAAGGTEAAIAHLAAEVGR